MNPGQYVSVLYQDGNEYVGAFVDLYWNPHIQAQMAIVDFGSSLEAIRVSRSTKRNLSPIGKVLHECIQQGQMRLVVEQQNDTSLRFRELYPSDVSMALQHVESSRMSQQEAIAALSLTQLT